MNNKHKIIISYLNSSESYSTSSEIAQYLGVSERSIKRYIKDINLSLEQYGAKIDSVKGLGYKLNILYSKEFKKYLQSINLDSKDESIRSVDMIRSILIHSPISLDSLCEVLFLSRSTLQNEIGQVREMFEVYDIKLMYKPYKGLYIEGEEEDIRKCCVKYFFKDDNDSELCENLDLINNNFITYLQKYIEKSFLDNNIFKNYYEIIYLSKFIAVCFFRSLNGNKIKLPVVGNYKDITSTFNDEFIKEIYENYDLAIDEDEILYANIIAKADKKLILNINPKEEYIRLIIMKVLIDIDIKYKVFLSEDIELIKYLTNHILNSYHRYYLKFNVDNTILNQVKMNYPQSLNYALELAKCIEDIFKVEINENELGYIAIHFATAIERLNQKTSYRAIIICNTGMGTSELLKTKLRRYFPDIEVIGCYQLNFINFDSFEEIDFIISTTSTKGYINNNSIIRVSPMMTNEDIDIIEKKLNEIYFNKYLKNLFSQDIFYYKSNLNNKMELIEFISDDMVQKGFISSKDKIDVIKRENISSTEISDLVAVPHCISNDGSNIIAICSLEKPIKWGSTKIKLVFIAFLNSEIKNNKNVFSFINSKIKKGDTVNRLCECVTLDKFTQVLMESSSNDS